MEEEDQRVSVSDAVGHRPDQLLQADFEDEGQPLKPREVKKRDSLLEHPERTPSFDGDVLLTL